MIALIASMALCQVSTELIDVANRIRAFRESWTSIEVRSRQDLVEHTRNYSMPLFENYIETALGQRLYELAYIGQKTGLPVRSTRYCDGDRCADVTSRSDHPDTITIKNAFSTEGQSAHRQCGTPLSYLYLMHKPLDAHLESATYLGESNVASRRCLRALITGVQWLYTPVEMIYDLDQETGFPLAISCFGNESDRDANLPTWTWTVSSFQKVDASHFFPMRSLVKTFDAKSTPALLATHDIHVIEVKFNQDYPAAMFWPETRPGSTVWDQIENVRHQVPKATTPVRAEVPADGASWFAWTALALGVAAIGGGVYLRWQYMRAA